MSKKNSDYEGWSKEDLIKEIEALRKKKTYGLVWENEKIKEDFDYYINWDGVKTKEKFPEAEHKFPVLKEIKKNEIISCKNPEYNILIEGDNYHTLAVLNFTHKQAVDLIYIDPPYNTGNKDFKFNDSWVDNELASTQAQAPCSSY
jgi:adenine-specific DNA-methyltransferase